MICSNAADGQYASDLDIVSLAPISDAECLALGFELFIMADYL